MEKFLNNEVIRQIKEVFTGLQKPVEVLFFGNKTDCEYCQSTQQLLSEVCALSDLLSLSIYDVDDHAEIAQKYHIDHTPGIVLAGRENGILIDYGIRFAGIPAGHEFTSLINDLIIVSGRDSGLAPETREFLKSLSKPIHLQVFVTPT
jgi:glutaredoxin-like protein